MPDNEHGWKGTKWRDGKEEKEPFEPITWFKSTIDKEKNVIYHKCNVRIMPFDPNWFYG
jgi:hypothetical protein